MFILSQDRTKIVEMSGVYLKTERWKSTEGGILSQRTVDHERINLICISKGEMRVQSMGDGAGSYTVEHKVGSFSTVERAKKEIEEIAHAILNQDELYSIKTK